jgi:hypothetical protein
MALLPGKTEPLIGYSNTTRLARITAELANLLGEGSHSAQRTALWTHILVDYTHGAALAAFQIGVAEILEAC